MNAAAAAKAKDDLDAAIAAGNVEFTINGEEVAVTESTTAGSVFEDDDDDDDTGPSPPTWDPDVDCVRWSNEVGAFVIVDCFASDDDSAPTASPVFRDVLGGVMVSVLLLATV